MYDEIYSNERVLGKCSLFGNENLVTGEIEYAHALVCRVDELKCGRNGKYFNTIIIQK